MDSIVHRIAPNRRQPLRAIPCVINDLTTHNPEAMVNRIGKKGGRLSKVTPEQQLEIECNVKQ
jgi:hypothetical protein